MTALIFIIFIVSRLHAFFVTALLIESACQTDKRPSVAEGGLSFAGQPCLHFNIRGLWTIRTHVTSHQGARLHTTGLTSLHLEWAVKKVFTEVGCGRDRVAWEASSHELLCWQDEVNDEEGGIKGFDPMRTKCTEGFGLRGATNRQN